MSIATYEQAILKLKKYFGYDTFREGQWDVISNLLHGEDQLVIMPTGGGKSLCYQLPSVLLPKTTLVISPLLALMKDQVDALNANGIEAAFFNSSLSSLEKEKVLQQIYEHELKLIYVAPESLSFLQPILNDAFLSLVAVDEAHCISSWGHDFRPAYKELAFLKKSMPNVPLVALTATADKATRFDITTQLSIPNAHVFIASFDRPNISLNVSPGLKRIDKILNFLSIRENQPGIIYCLSRKSTEDLAQKLSFNGYKASAYHAGLDYEERGLIQDSFLQDEVQIICATIAFGMGIDKSNIRWVIHYNMPKNIEGYYQEIGRSGRDGAPATALLFYSYADFVQLKEFSLNSSNEEFQLAKLERMHQFAEATTCRRKMLLSYFGEFLAEDCGNCDVCRNPPQFFDGTTYAQMALSAIVRANQAEGINTIIDILRGAQNQRVYQKQYHELKTFGIGKQVPWADWQHYITQLINQGFCEIAFHENNHLKLSASAKHVLFEKHPVYLTKFQQKKVLPSVKELSFDAPDSGLLETLKQLRREIAQRDNVPAFVVFNDASLSEMAAKKPQSESEFLQISGVGQRKLEVYGEAFLSLLKNSSPQKKTKRTPKKKSTYEVTFELYKEGFSVEEIAQKRGLAPTTVCSHFAKLMETGKEIAIEKFVTAEELNQIEKAHNHINDLSAMKPYFEFLEEKIDYGKIRLGVSYLQFRNK
jgi:ATP-dependent DNA helicase RecQ